MMITPTKDYILLTVDKKKEEVSAGGIYLPEKASSEPQCGVVAYEYTLYQEKTVDVERGLGGYASWPVGTKIWYKKWAGESINYNGTDYLLVHIKDVLAFEIGGES